MFRKALFVTLVLALAAGCPKKKENPPPPPPATFGPSAIAGGDDALLMVSGDMLAWTQVLQTESLIQADADITKIVKVPGHASNRLVAIVDNPTLAENDLIYYNDNGGTGAWTKANFGTGPTDFSYLDAQHRPGAGQDEWTLNDVFFIDSTTGYAVGTGWIILWTYDAGATWHDLNVYQGATPATVDFQHIDLGTSIPAEFVAGATVIDGAAGTHTGRIISVDEYYDQIVVDVDHATRFLAGDQIRVGTGTAINCTIYEDNLWKFNTWNIQCVWATVAAGIHTVTFGLDNAADCNGIWHAVSNNAATPDVRTFLFFGAPAAEQYQTGGIGTYEINGLYFFDALVGVAGTYDGVWYTTDGGLDWTQFAASDNNTYYNFVYSQSTTTTSGYLYCIDTDEYYNNPGRVAVTYTGTAWTLGATWEEHADLNCDMYYVDGSVTAFYHDGKVFMADGSDSSGAWGYCSDPNNAVFNDTFWQDSGQQYMGGDTATNPTNPTYDKGVLDDAAAPSGWINTICKR